jgi:hypothetical protein
MTGRAKDKDAEEHEKFESAARDFTMNSGKKTPGGAGTHTGQ